MNTDCKVLYNTCYGGFCPSYKAMKLYNNRKKEIEPNFEDLLCAGSIQRHDPILIQLYYELNNELNNEFNADYSKISIFSINKEYEEYYEISDYDGKEHVSIDINRYKLDKTKEILKNKMNNDEKIFELNKIYDL